MPTSRFDSAAAGHLVGDGRVSVDLDPVWNVDGRILNGGYLQAVAVRAAGLVLAAESDTDTAADPVVVSTSFAAPAAPGPADVVVEVLRRGGRLSSATATLRQGERAVLATLATFGDLPDAAGNLARRSERPVPGANSVSRQTVSALAMPDVPVPDRCISVPTDAMPGVPGLASVVDLAFVPAQSDWLRGKLPDALAVPTIRCWMSFTDARPLDPLAVIALADMAPPVSFAQGRFGWAPTLHLQVGLFARPVGRYLLLDLRGEPYDGAFVAEDGLMWDEAGTLIARSRQIAVPPRR